ncbi:TPA: hypothetical protein JD203_21630 [Cronobacter sakazakii]|nr:hypothetical protein [Salmonella enterica]KAB1465153.1 hypothetical protein F8B49_06975 [Salmonella enterica subsp. enterica serovar Schwarzengrund]HAU5504428.1 hypothetical protein [Cronobacter sakazakii]HBW8876354.1 hypothetical protein [Klebsiella quasipneumoniae subsp. similipneumoniae]
MYRVVCCRFYLTAAPFVANLSGAVRARDVMVNKATYMPSKMENSIEQILSRAFYYIHVLNKRCFASLDCC